MGASPQKKQPTKPHNMVVDMALAALWLVVTYLLGSKALDSGSLWYYLLTFVGLGLFVRSLRILIMHTYDKR